MRRDTIYFLVPLVLLLAAKAGAGGVAANDWRWAVKPDALADLKTPQGAALMTATWRFRAADVVAVDHRAPGHDLKPSSDAIRTHDLSPLASAADFDDGAWEVLDPTTLEARRGTGRVSFAWYRTKFTVPENVGEFATTGSTVVFEIVVDDYSEVTVDGKLPQVLGQRDGRLIAGWNEIGRAHV